MLLVEETTLILTNDDNFWSCGRNDFGQLCHGDKEDRLKTSKNIIFKHIKNISGWNHSLFQNNKGEILACGENGWGQCGLGHFNESQMTPSLILNLPSNIVDLTKIYFLIQKELYFPLGRIQMASLVLVEMEIKMN